MNVIFKNEGKGKSVILRNDFKTIELKEGEQISIDERLILRYPSTIKKYTEEEFKKLNTKKESKENKVQKPKQDVKTESKENKVQKPKQDVKTESKKPVRRTSTKKQKGDNNVEDK